MFNKKKPPQIESLDDYVFVNKKNYYISKKPTDKFLFFQELTIYFLISLASYFSIYIGTNKFTDQKTIESNIDLLTQYFSIENLENTLIGIFMVIGILSSLNYIITNSKISLDNILNRLTHSFLDLIFLMLSSMLGLFLAVLEFTSIITNQAEVAELRKTLFFGITLLICVIICYTFITVTMKINGNKIKD